MKQLYYILLIIPAYQALVFSSQSHKSTQTPNYSHTNQFDQDIQTQDPYIAKLAKKINELEEESHRCDTTIANLLRQIAAFQEKGYTDEDNLSNNQNGSKLE